MALSAMAKPDTPEDREPLTGREDRAAVRSKLVHGRRIGAGALTRPPPSRRPGRRSATREDKRAGDRRGDDFALVFDKGDDPVDCIARFAREHLTGDVAIDEQGEPQVHAHVVIGKSDGSAHGGHLLEARVWPTLEIVLAQSAEPLRKRVDPETGLALIALDR